MADIVS